MRCPPIYINMDVKEGFYYSHSPMFFSAVITFVVNQSYFYISIPLKFSVIINHIRYT